MEIETIETRSSSKALFENDESYASDYVSHAPQHEVSRLEAEAACER